MMLNTLTPAQSKAVRDRVQEVRDKYGIHGRAFTRADFYRIAKGERIALIDPNSFPDRPKLVSMRVIRGFYSWQEGVEDGVKMIYLRCFWLKRFDLPVAFHELGHHFMGHRGGFKSWEQDSQKEAEADEFSGWALSRFDTQA